jgi:NADH-quinone oxidoreductase subunit J
MELFVFVVSAIAVLAGAIGVVVRPNPVHAALSLILTLFGIAVLFVAQEANFLAAVQVIVYAGAIVVLFLFVIMLLGVERSEDLRTDPIGGQRPLAAIIGLCLLGLLLAAGFVGGGERITGQRSAGAPLNDGGANQTPDIQKLAHSLFGDYVFAFEITSILLVIAVLGTVLFARRPARPIDDDSEAER